jgi:methyl-accepting chemotaxis protein
VVKRSVFLASEYAGRERQSSTSAQIARNVEAISTVTGETAQATQQIAKTAEDLNRLTENLQHIVDRFRLENEGAPEETAESLVLA